MKKLMVVLAAVAMAACAQAAQVKWQVAAAPTFTGQGLTDHNGAAFTGTGYLILAADAATAAANLAKDGTLGVTTYGQNTTWSALSGGMDSAIASDNTLSPAAAVPFAVVLLQEDGDDLWYKVSTASDPVKPSTDLVGSPADVAFTAGTHFAGAWNSYSAVPEPTSGLLLLLGVAGLALKRKRA